MNLAELKRLAKRKRLAFAVAAIAIVFVLWLSDFWTFVFIGAIGTALIALSVGIVYGRTGMVSLCQFSFAAVSVWVIGWLTVNTGLPFAVLLVIGGLAAVPFGAAIGLLSLRLRGVNLAVATLGFASASLVVLFENPVPGTFANQPVRRPGGFPGENGYFLFACIVLAAVAALLSVIGRTRYGRAWIAVRQSERATASLGLSVARVKLTAFSVGAFVAGIGGGVLAGLTGLVSNRSFEPFDSLLIFAIAILAGARYVDGAIAAGIFGAVLPELFRKWGIPLDIPPIMFAIAAIRVLSKNSEGAAGRIRLRTNARKVKLAGQRPAEPLPSVEPAPSPEPAWVTKREAHDLDIAGLSVAYGAVVALDGVSISVKVGEVHGLIGPNGAGKSTLIDAVTGFVAQDSGHVTLGPTILDDMPVHKRARSGIRRTFQQGRVIQEMEVGAYLTFAAGRTFEPGAIDEILEFFSCPGPETLISSIDVATRRLVEVAGAFASEASIVLLDEPGAGLADAESARLAKCISAAPSRFECGVLLVEHDMEIVRIACDRLTVLDFGSVIASGVPSEVLAADAVVAAYLGGTTESVAGEQ